MKKQRIWRSGAGVAIAIMSFQTLPAWSQPAYQTPDGRRVDCSNRGPLDAYKAAQDQDSKPFRDANKKRAARKKKIAEKVAAFDEQHTKADNEVKELDQQISEKEDALKQAQGDEKRRLENELGNLRTGRIVKRAERLRAHNQWEDAQKELQDIENEIRDADAQAAKYEGRKRSADASYTEHCSCKEPLAWNALEQKCECARQCDWARFESLDAKSCTCLCDQCCQRRRADPNHNCGGQSR